MNILKTRFDYGNHFILDLYDCNTEKLYFTDGLLERIKFIISANKGTIQNQTHHVFSNDAYTILILLSESHVSFHSYPELNYIAIDIFTCGSSVLTANIATLLISYFESTRPLVQVIQRNNPDNNERILYEVGDYYSDENSEFRVLFRKCKIIHFEQTQYQVITIIENDIYGKILLLDNMLMIIENLGSYTCHMIKSIERNLIDDANILIIGGGDLVIGDELNKYATRKGIKLNITIVDIDKEVTDQMIKHFGFTLDNINVIYSCGYEYLANTNNIYDGIILDITDPIGDNVTPSSILTSRSFYELLYSRMDYNASFVQQYGSTVLFKSTMGDKPIYKDIFTAQSFEDHYTDEYFTYIRYLKGVKTL